MSGSDHLAQFFDGLRATGTKFNGTNAQLAQLFLSGLELLAPDSAAAAEDVDTLSADMEVVIEALSFTDGDAYYPDEEEGEA